MPSGRQEWKSFKGVMSRELGRIYDVAVDEFNEYRKASADTKEEQGGEAKDTRQALLDNLLQNSTPYTYETLPLDSIRLLEIHPSELEHKPLQCHLVPISLQDSPGKYEALSYVWGDPDQPKEWIFIDGHAKEIYGTLERILIKLRRTKSVRTLWVDAICIDQSSIEERNKQVPLMGSIYRGAARTVAWLGPVEMRTTEIFTLLQELSAEAQSPPFVQYYGAISSQNRIGTLPLLPGFESKELPLPESAVQEKWGGDMGIWEIIACPWWFRAWTAQELLLSPNLAIAPYFAIRTLEERRSLQQTQPEVYAVHPAENLLHLLLNCRHRVSKDPRDKIYALLGMLDDGQSSPAKKNSLDMVANPDYGNPVVYIYRRISQQCIEQTGSLDIIGVCPPSTRRGLPSWVTDWSITSKATHPLMSDSLNRPRLTHATRGSKAKPRFPADAVTIILDAYELTTVVEVSEVLPPILWYMGINGDSDGAGEEETYDFKREMKETWAEMSTYLHNQAQYWKMIFEWERFAARRQPQNPTNQPEWIYWQTLCAGTYTDGDPQRTVEQYNAWLETLEVVRTAERRYKGLASKITPFRYSMNSKSWKGFSEFACYLECAHSRRLGWAADGWLCLLPEGTEPGDRVILAEGGRVPLVIRPDGDGYNMLIGEAYIQGIMDGEVFDRDKCHDVKIC
ncbi:heterokaryon incompatibility protein-domain-containing protein [Stachybotrys elegans]|uniref:Heterokaryon incompatibility protein-domain-containing protein n=1 Tax=Stachybotrys elegans TaxID=80388 RepID=A0A8K0SUJ5_9HYPO|nr:heterokaryon incompatibility protein-domain-containing protein [Stachybotrys elegans]